MDRLATLHFSEGQLSEREYLAARDSLDQKLTELKDQLVPDTPKSDIPVLWTSWKDGDTDTRREVIKEIAGDVVVLPGVRGRKGVDAGRLQYQSKYQSFSAS